MPRSRGGCVYISWDQLRGIDVYCKGDARWGDVCCATLEKFGALCEAPLKGYGVLIDW
jgi:hypothetical protein